MHKRGKSDGWAAFDQQQRQKPVDGRVGNDPFPSLSGTTTVSAKPERVFGNKQLSAKPFSSVVVPSVDFITLTPKTKKNKQLELGNSDTHRRNNSSDSSFDTILRRLKEEYSWADDNLIEDIMASVDNDLDTASSFLKSMISDNVIKGHNCRGLSNGIQRENVQTASEPPTDSPSTKACTDIDIRNNDSYALGEKFSDNLIAINTMPRQLAFVPVEPEWEDDDVYLSCRKDAIKIMRAAARHSKAATNSFLRGDHYSAQQFSVKSQEEWESANRLNEMAAREILHVRNESNGIWRLDLHGLHASEAVQALREHLHMIETQSYFNDSNSPSQPDGSRMKVDVLHASSSTGANKMHKPSDQGLCRPNLKWLEVITGIGNHSRGGASLPTAVKTFLVDNGYRIDEARPGVIMVRPKLRSG